MLFKDKFYNCFEKNKDKFKKCMVEIEFVYKVVCMNMDLVDEVKEIIIFGWLKCGKVFIDDEVVVEIFGKFKV